MYVRHLSVADFRSWQAVDVAFDAGPVALIGPNGEGKTNLVEALGYLATLTSHRVSTDAHLAEHGAQLMWARLAAVEALRPHAAAAYAQVAPSSAPLTLRYITVVPGVGGGPPPEPAVLETALLAELAKARPAELERGVNLVGPHRDDLELGIGELPVRGYASHGEGWSVALAL